MWWGEPRRRPPLTRSRGMFAASLLVVGVLASYVCLAVLSLAGSTGSLSLPGVSAVNDLAGRVLFTQPSVDSVIKGHTTASPAGPPVGLNADEVLNLGASSGSGAVQRSIDLHNTSGSPLTLRVWVHGAPGVTAQFSSGGNTTTVPALAHASMTIVSNPLYAGVIKGQLVLSSPSFSPMTVQFTADQAPAAPGAVTATPATGGAVDLSWTPSPSTGVAGYVIQRSDGTAAGYQQVGAVTAATTAVDQTPADGSYSYQVVAEAQGTSGMLDSSPGPAATAVSDSTPPGVPALTGVPAYLNAAEATPGTAAAYQVTVSVPATSVASDTVTVTLTDGTTTLFHTYPGGFSSQAVAFPKAYKLADGPLTLSATAADSLGNSVATTPITVTKDTVAPDAPVLPDPLPQITPDNAGAYPLTVTTAAADQGGVVTVTFTDPSGATVTKTATQGAGDTSAAVSADLTSLADGEIAVTATATDAAGNTSAAASGQATKHVIPPAKPDRFGVLAGPDNPAGYVNAASQGAVTIAATFPQALPADDTLTLTFADRSYQAAGGSSTVSFGPLDLSGLPDGQYQMKLVVTDSAGLTQPAWRSFTKDTVAPAAPTGVGVPAGAANPAGYVNASTQSEATIVASFAGSTDPGDRIALAVGGRSVGVRDGGDAQVAFTADLSGLPDGTLDIAGTIADAAGNSTSFSGSLTKDTQPPAAPVTAGVLGPPANTITPGGASCVKVGVVFDQAPDPSDTVTVTLSDGSTSVQGSAPGGTGAVTVGCIDASSLSAGPIAVSVTVTDAAGNSVTVAGTQATKLRCGA
jgi:large repetitive protein